MRYSDIEALVFPLLEALPKRQRESLTHLLNSPSTYNLFDSLDSEIFIQGLDLQSNNSLLIVSSLPAEGKTTVALALAILSAAFDPTKRILLVDGDVSKGSLAGNFGIDAASPGLYDFVPDKTPLESCCHSTKLKNLFITPLRSSTSGLARFAPARFEAFANSARMHFDLVVMDSASGGSRKTTVAMSKILVNTLLVIKYRGPTRHQIKSFQEDLERSGANIIGAIINQRKYEIPRIFYGAGG